MNALPAQSYAADISYNHADRRPHKAEDAYRTISEVADELNVAQHVLRFWESKFKQIEPMKRAGGRRYYRREDVDLLKRIHFLLYSQGYTIKGVQKLLVKDKQLVQAVPALGGAHVLPENLPPGLRQPAGMGLPKAAPAMATPAASQDVSDDYDGMDDEAGDDQLSLFNASDRVMMLDVLRRLKAARDLLDS